MRRLIAVAAIALMAAFVPALAPATSPVAPDTASAELYPRCMTQYYDPGLGYKCGPDVYVGIENFAWNFCGAGCNAYTAGTAFYAANSSVSFSVCAAAAVNNGQQLQWVGSNCGHTGYWWHCGDGCSEGRSHVRMTLSGSRTFKAAPGVYTQYQDGNTWGTCEIGSARQVKNCHWYDRDVAGANASF